MNKKHILVLDLIIVVGTLMIIVGLVGYGRPLVIAPLPDSATANTSVLFAFEGGEGVEILIDDNLEFTSPQRVYVEDNLVINLKPGEYYWKIENDLIGGVRKFTIRTEVDLKLKRLDDGFEVVNSGNTRLSVDVYDGADFVEGIKLDVDESSEVSGTKFIGGQDG